MKYLFCVLVLAACAPQQPVFKPVVVDVPVSVPCSGVTITKPDFAFQHVGTPDDVLSKTKAALEELDQRKAYEAELEAWEMGCE